jgi:hypothetical protein
MIIAIDFDDTLTSDPNIWRPFVEKARERGHSVYCVTCRRNTSENYEDIDNWMDENDIQLPIVFTNLRSKRNAMLNRGLNVDIWIDDSPRTVYEDM